MSRTSLMLIVLASLTTRARSTEKPGRKVNA